MGAIAGIMGKQVRPKQIGKMLNLLRHRGPDNSTIRNLSQGAVGCADLATSHQATFGFSGDREPFVLLDGELYNSRPYEMTNVALLRELYLLHGKDCFSFLDGSYACAIIDEDEVILARDHIGARPLIYGTEKGKLCFASEAKALVDYCSQIEELPPGHSYSNQDGLQSFNSLNAEVPDFETPEEAAKTLRELMVEAVRKRMADGAVEGVSLSGGLDSSIIAAIAKQFNAKLKLFSCTIKKYPSKDIGYAKLMANYLGLEHHIYQITNEDIARLIPRAIWHLESFDEDCVSGFIANFYTSRLISRFTNCILVGEGADELFGGYFGEIQQVSDLAQKEEVARKLVDIAYNTALRRLDRGWMANSVNYRTPYLDPAVTALSNKIPLELKVRQDLDSGREIEKWIVREAFRDCLPSEIANRPKLRFARGVGVDDLMDEITAKKVSQKEFRRNPQSQQGIAFNSPKELYYYRLFRKHLPRGYEKLTARWDPFK